MRRWQQISAIGLGLLAFLAEASTALAQDDSGNLPPVLGGILVKLATIVDGILSVWVNSATGNTLTDPNGERLVSALAELARNTVLFFAQFFQVLTFG
jgi:hypothetical protein